MQHFRLHIDARHVWRTAQKSVALFMALLFVLASARQMVPNLCATWAQAETHTLTVKNGPVYGGCCVMPEPDSKKRPDDRPSWSSYDTPAPPCPFCNLATSTAPVYARSATLLPLRVAATRNVEYDSFVPETSVLTTKSLRGPPFPA